MLLGLQGHYRLRKLQDIRPAKTAACEKKTWFDKKAEGFDAFQREWIVVLWEGELSGNDIITVSVVSRAKFPFRVFGWN